MNMKRMLVALAAGAAAVAMAGSAAYAVATYRAGGYTARQYIIDSTDAYLVPSVGVWVTVPSTTVTATVPAGTSRLLTARFNAESLCTGGGWCSVRIVYYTPAGVPVELAPQSGSDYAFDSDGDLWSAHSVERTTQNWLPGGSYRVAVQAMRVSATQFRIDDYQLNVGLITP